jgi:integrase
VEKFKIARSKSKVVRGEIERARSIASVNRELALLSRIFTLAKDKGEAASNPVSEVKFLRGETKRTRYLLPEEETSLFAQFVGKRARLRLIVLIALNTGMRLTEILTLKRANLDFHRNEIHVTKTKTFRSRAVPMNAIVRTELLDHLSHSKSDYVFVSPVTGKATVSVESAFEAARKDAGLEDFRFHDLRHTAATRMAERGIDPFTIAAILGHSSIIMTASYAHATQQSKRAAVAALEDKTEKLGHNVGHISERREKLAVGK